ncbi:MAG TPA: gliding motility-associated protein GldE [Chitinophagaceae bacterium]|nr:gliding motility-associated protein GldE [Chitinophagaceae bacterium]
MDHSVFGHFVTYHSTHLLAVNLQGTTFLIILLLALFLLIFTISGAEVALFSLTSRDVNMLKTKQHLAARRIISLLEERQAVFTSLLIANTFFSICIIVLCNFLIDQFIPFRQLLAGLGGLASLLDLILKVLLIAFGLIFFGKILPKVWATQNNIRFAYGSSLVVDTLHRLLRRLSRRMVSLADVIGRRLGANRSQITSLRELDEAIDITADSEASEEEKKILKGIVKFGNISVKQVMRSRLDINGIEYGTRFDALVRQLGELHYSRVPVYRGSLDEIAGIINTKDLVPHLGEGEHFDWHPLMRQPYFVPESKLIEDLLKEFQARRIHFAVVVDEFGGTSGIVTLEDILEEIIGEIKDEFDEEESRNRRIDENNWLFEGKTMINDVCKMMDLPQDTFDRVRGNSESLAGLVLELAGKFPETNEVIPCGDFEFTILESSMNRINQIKLTVKNKP